MAADKQGLVQVYTGNGKGKTTAALGLAIRAAGRGFRVVLIQFLKEAERGDGDARAVSRTILPIIIKRFGEDLLAPVSENKRKNIEQRVAAGLDYARTALKNDVADLVILDEISHVVNLGLCSEDAVSELIDLKPARVELVLTGRDMPSSIIKKADLVTEMKNIRHPFDAGTGPRYGIEY